MKTTVINLGIDIGNGNTKFLKGSERHLFESKTELAMIVNDFGKKEENVHEIAYNGLTYYVGKGNEFTTNDRHTSKPYLLCMLTAIALSTDDTTIKADVCIGVPTLMFISNKERVREIMEYYNSDDMKEHAITVNGIEKNITLNNLYVFSENAAPLINNDDDNQILIDIGEGTVNISQWENQVPVKVDTKEGKSSFLGLYIQIANYLKAKKKCDIDHKYIQKCLGQDSILVNGIEEDFTFSKEMLENHVRTLASNIKTTFDLVSAKKVLITGGGAIPTELYWKKVLALDNVSVVDNSQFINSQVYQSYANMKSLQNKVKA